MTVNVPWPEVLAVVAGRAWPDDLAHATHCAVAECGVFDLHAFCAELIACTEVRAAFSIAMLDLDDPRTVWERAVRTAHAYRTRCPTAHRGEPAPPRPRATPGPAGLSDPHRLARTWRGFATDVATLQPHGRLELRLDHLAPAAAGNYRCTETGGLITVDTDAARTPDTLDHVLAHELAHAIEATDAGRHAAASETFAETLAARLLEHRPARLADAQGWIAEARAAYDRVAPPSTTDAADDIDDVWLLVDFLATDLQVPSPARTGEGQGTGPGVDEPTTRQPSEAVVPARAPSTEKSRQFDHAQHPPGLPRSGASFGPIPRGGHDG